MITLQYLSQGKWLLWKQVKSRKEAEDAIANGANPTFVVRMRPRRYRHTTENDKQTALIKRINRKYASLGCPRKVRVIKGVVTLINTEIGEIRPSYTLEYLKKVLNVA